MYYLFIFWQFFFILKKILKFFYFFKFKIKKKFPDWLIFNLIFFIKWKIFYKNRKIQLK